ncbi:hypothetical protein [Streptomyces sp. NBC_00005]|uniref:hypothetical protein n=1 Tax=Streptomyces sp. NBC_00005 TaxID=2903609 RepID=UPI003252EB9C
MVQELLGHAQLETTKAIYLAPVADLQLRSLLADFAPAGGPVSEQELAGLFTRLARESEGIQDLDEKLVAQ